jgi:hypothetical protein
LPDLRKAPGDGVKSADIDGIGGSRSTNMKCSDCGGGECAGGFDQEISAVNGAALSSAKPRCKPLACGFLHLILPSPGFDRRRSFWNSWL